MLQVGYMFISTCQSTTKVAKRWVWALASFLGERLTVATPWTWAVVPSGNVMMGLLGSTWKNELVNE